MSKWLRTLTLRAKIIVFQVRVKLRVVLKILRGEAVCYRANFVDGVRFCGEDPVLVECAFWDGGKWHYGKPTMNTIFEKEE